MGAYFEFLRIDDLGFDFVHSCVPDRHLFGINERQRRVAVRNMHCVSICSEFNPVPVLVHVPVPVIIHTHLRDASEDVLHAVPKAVHDFHLEFVRFYLFALLCRNP